MKNYYYLIWSDAIQRTLHYHTQGNWQWGCGFRITMVNSLNLFSIVLWLKILNIWDKPSLDIILFNNKLDSLISYLLTFVLPFVVMNYFLIFFRERYKRIVIRYPVNDYNNYLMKYLLYTFLLLLITIIVFTIMK